MFERALICTDLFDGLHRLVHCVPHLALSGLKQVIFLHSIPVWEQPTLAAVDQAKMSPRQIAPTIAGFIAFRLIVSLICMFIYEENQIYRTCASAPTGGGHLSVGYPDHFWSGCF